MGYLKDRMEQDLKLAGYSPSTIRIYLLYSKEFAKHFMLSPTEMGDKEIRTYLLYLLDERKLSHDTYRQAHAALKFLYTVTLQREFTVGSIPRPRRPKRLPEVLSGTEVQMLLSSVTNLKYRAIITTIYATGLRIAEACKLWVKDIDSKRMLIHVRQGKGGKDRYVILSERLLRELRDYWRVQRPPEFLFPGKTKTGHISPESVRSLLRKASSQVGITKNVTPHILRHTFATHLLETGTDIAVIQALLGHNNIHETTRYTHISTSHIQGIRSPLDLLGTPEGIVLR